MDTKDQVKLKIAEISEIVQFTTEQKDTIVEYLYGDSRMSDEQCLAELHLTDSQREIFISYCLHMQ